MTDLVCTNFGCLLIAIGLAFVASAGIVGAFAVWSVADAIRAEKRHADGAAA